MASNLYIFSLGNRPIMAETTGTALYDKAKSAGMAMFTFPESTHADHLFEKQFPSYPTVMAALRRDSVYRFTIRHRGVDFNFSIGTVPRPTSLTDEITEAISKAVESIQRTQ